MRVSVIIKFELISFLIIRCFISCKKHQHYCKLGNFFSYQLLYVTQYFNETQNDFEICRKYLRCFHFFYGAIFEDGLRNIWPKQIITCSEVHIGMFAFGLLLIPDWYYSLLHKNIAWWISRLNFKEGFGLFMAQGTHPWRNIMSIEKLNFTQTMWAFVTTRS